MKLIIQLLMILVFILVLPVNGFASLPLPSDNTEDEYLDMSIEELMKIKVITAGKKVQPVDEVGASVIVITKEEIQAYGYQSMEEIFENTLGFYKINDYKSANFGVRGFFSNVYNRSIIFLINGVQQRMPDVDWNIFTGSNLQVEAIEKIEIVKGPNAIQYGNNAFFGVINVITNSHSPAANTKNATLVFGSNNTLRANANISLNSPTSKTTINSGYYATDGLSKPFSTFLDSVQDNTKAFQKTGTTEGFFKQKSYYFNVSTELDDFYIKLSYDETYRNLIHNLPPILDTTKNTRNEQVFRGNFGWRKSINSFLELDCNVGYVSFNLVNTYQLGSVAPIRRDQSINPSTGKEAFGKLIAFLSPTDNITSTIGFEYNSIFFQDDFIVSPNSKTLIYQKLQTPANLASVFGQIDIHLTKQLTFTGGVRLDYLKPYTFENQYYERSSIDTAKVYSVLAYGYNYTKVKTTPKVALIYKPGDESKIIKLMYSQAKSRPSVYENAYALNTVHPELEPQNISTLELNYYMSIDKNLYVTTSLFYNKLSDLIARINTIDTLTRTVVIETKNGNALETVGAELECIYSPIRGMRIDAALSYQHTQNILKDTSTAGAYSPQILANIKVMYNATDHLVIGAESYFVGAMESEFDTSPINVGSGNFAPKGRISKTTPAYMNVSANIRYNNIFGSNFYAAVHCSNLLNTAIEYAPTLVNRSYLPNGTVGYGTQVNVVAGVNF